MSKFDVDIEHNDKHEKSIIWIIRKVKNTIFQTYFKKYLKYSYFQVELICPVTNDLVFCGVICDLILVDFIATGSISIHVEDHWGASNS